MVHTFIKYFHLFFTFFIFQRLLGKGNLQHAMSPTKAIDELKPISLKPLILIFLESKSLNVKGIYRYNTNS